MDLLEKRNNGSLLGTSHLYVREAKDSFISATILAIEYKRERSTATFAWVYVSDISKMRPDRRERQGSLIEYRETKFDLRGITYKDSEFARSFMHCLKVKFL